MSSWKVPVVSVKPEGLSAGGRCEGAVEEGGHLAAGDGVVGAVAGGGAADGDAGVAEAFDVVVEGAGGVGEAGRGCRRRGGAGRG